MPSRIAIAAACGLCSVAVTVGCDQAGPRPTVGEPDRSGVALGSDNRAIAVAEGRTPVAQVSSIAIVPAAQSLRRGASARFQVMADGVPLAPGAVQWSITDAEVAIVSQDGTISGRAAGTAEIRAAYGDLNARATVEILAAAVPAFAIHPANVRVSVGRIISLEALSATGPIEARWTSASPGVVASLGGNLFRAVSPGVSKVCASAAPRRSCTSVEVAR